MVDRFRCSHKRDSYPSLRCSLAPVVMITSFWRVAQSVQRSLKSAGLDPSIFLLWIPDSFFGATAAMMIILASGSMIELLMSKFSLGR